jgi:hypothetical protein
MSFGNPLPEEIFVVGIIGVSLFAIILVLSLYNLTIASQPLAALFFWTMTLMSILECPRYIVMIAMKEYVSTYAYSCHILASCLYFMCVSLVCFMWARLLELGKYSNVLYSKWGVLTINIIVGILALTMSAMCIMSSSLHNFFESTAFIVYTLSEVVALTFYSGVVAVFGVRLLSRYYI